jgi:hypothetical protein
MQSLQNGDRRRMVIMANNGIRGWGPAIDRFRVQGREQGSDVEGSNGC